MHGIRVLLVGLRKPYELIREQSLLAVAGFTGFRKPIPVGCCSRVEGRQDLVLPVASRAIRSTGVSAIEGVAVEAF